MNSSRIELNQVEFLLLKDYIEQECGIVIRDEKAYLIESKLVRLVNETHSKTFRDFYLKAKDDKSGKLKSKIIDAMTINETMWFRDVKPWTILRELLIPQYIDALRSNRKEKVIIWSMAASTGQEAYSTALLIDEALKKEPAVTTDRFVILGTDISASALYMAISGRYSQLMMSRGMLEGYPEKYFTESNSIFEIKSEIKQMVKFFQFNLIDDFAKIPVCDLVLCRNVAIYFSNELKKNLFKKVSGKISTDGHLFLGATENLLGVSEDFEQLEYQKGIYFKPKKRRG